jgi:hypothetical protein
VGGPWELLPFLRWELINQQSPIEIPAAPPLYNVLVGDTVLSFLERELDTFAWTFLAWPLSAGGGGRVGFQLPTSNHLCYLCSTLTDADIQALWPPAEVEPPTVVVNVPPTYPGVDKVTLGTPVALAMGVTITEPMDGVIISITAVAPAKPYFTYDDLRGYRHIGTLVFLNDEGQAEQWQDMNFTSAIYCCRTIGRAAAVKIRTASGTEGTVTPWLITPDE